MKKNMDNLRKTCFPVFHTSCDIFIENFYIFSALTSFEDILNGENFLMHAYNMAIPIHTVQYTVLLYCVIPHFFIDTGHTL